MDTIFDITVTHARTIGGYTCAQCLAISSANVVMLKDKVIKKLLLLPNSMQHWITSLSPEELRNNETNFFSFVGNCRDQNQTLNQHMRAFYLHNVFMVIQMGRCQQRNAGVLQFQVEPATYNSVTNASGNQIPIMEDCVQEIGNLFNIWHNLNKMEVLESCCIYYQHAEDFDHQILTRSYKLLIKNIDASLQQHILSACENLPEYALSGPFAFVIMAEFVMSTTQNLAHNINSGLLPMSLRNFEGEDVVKCMFILGNVLCFLNYGILGFDRTPPLLMNNLFDIFMSATNTQFCN